MAPAVLSSDLRLVKIDEWILVVAQASDIERGHQIVVVNRRTSVEVGLVLGHIRSNRRKCRSQDAALREKSESHRFSPEFPGLDGPGLFG